MFSREKKKVEPTGRPKSGRKGKKAAWESFFSKQEKQSILEQKPTKNGHVAYFRPQRQPESEDSNEHDHFNTSPNTSRSLSDSFPKGFESLWKSRTRSDLKTSSFEGKWPRRDDEIEDNLDSSFEGQLSRSGHSLNASFGSSWSKRSGSRNSLNLSGNLDFLLSATYPPVKAAIVEKIQEGKYVNFQELLIENLVEKNKKLNENGRIDDITKWIECMGLYIAICSDVNVYHVRNLIAYQSIILHLRSEEHTSELQSRQYLVCRLLLEKKKNLTPLKLICQSLC